MKKIVLASLATLTLAGAFAQQKEGKVTYQRTANMQITISDQGGEPITRTRTDRFEMNFANNQMSWKQLEDDIQDDAGGNGGIMIRTMGGGDDMTFCDFNLAKRVELREFFDKKFLVIDSIKKGAWKLSDETKTILGYTCRKATTPRYTKRMQMSMENGKMERKEINDTSLAVAWFTTDIPVSVGPELAGQLPGIILELALNQGKTVYTATNINAKPDLSAIKEPTKGKKVTPAEFALERNKMMEEMQKNNGGRGGFQIRTN